MATFSRGPGGGVVEHSRSRRRAYQRPTARPLTTDTRPVTLSIRVVGLIMRRINSMLRDRGVRGFVANASFEQDGYHLHATLLIGGDTKVAMFSEMPKGKYKVFP